MLVKNFFKEFGMKHKIFVILAVLMFIGSVVWAGGGQDDTTATAAVAEGEYSQSPFLDERVASGELPPVDERLPKNPLVIEPLEEIGTYGGHLTIFGHDPNPWEYLVGSNPEGAPPAINFNLEGKFVPHMAEEFEQSSDYMTMTIKLREGSKWSNGDPFSGEDWRFMYEEMQKKEVRRSEAKKTYDSYCVVSTCVGVSSDINRGWPHD